MDDKMPVLFEYRFNIDKKNRLFIPAKHRESLGETLVIGPSFRTKSLTIFSLEEWKKIDEKVRTLKGAEREEFEHLFYSRCDTYVPDAQGRVTLVQDLVDAAKLEGPVVIEGMGSTARIWNAALYDEFKAAQTKHTLEDLADLADL